MFKQPGMKGGGGVIYKQTIIEGKLNNYLDKQTLIII